MNENQNRLEEELSTICNEEYDGDKNKMILDLLIVMGYWAEFELRDATESESDSVNRYVDSISKEVT